MFQHSVTRYGSLYLRESMNRLRRMSLLPRTREQMEVEFPLNAVSDCVKVLTVSPKSRYSLSAALKSLPSPYTHFESHCRAAETTILSQLSPKVIAAIIEFRSSPLAPGALVITGLPIDPLLPMTPSDGERSREKTSYISEGCLTGIAKLIGEPFGYSSEKNGAVIHNVCPVQHHETEQSNESSKIELSLHVENAYFDLRPDYILLYCLRQDHNKEARTSVVDIRSVLARMDFEDVALLQKPLFMVPSPPSHHGAMGGEKWSSPRPLFENLDNPNLICHFPGMKALGSKAEGALKRFEKAAHNLDVIHHIALEPASILLINNRKVAHGRTCFKASYDGNDRWLQRAYVTGKITQWQL